MTRIPADPIGYSVNLATGTIHTRYAGDHAGEVYRTRTEKGVTYLLDGKQGQPCAICYPSPVYRSSKPKSPQKRRTPKG